MLVINRTPINANNDADNYEVLVERQARIDRDYATFRNYHSTPTGSTVAVQQEDGRPCTHGTITDRGNCND